MKIHLKRSSIFRLQILFPADTYMAKTAEELKTGIRRRTSSGRDVDGKSFAGYAPSTARQRSRLGLKTGVVTLQRTGALLAGMAVRTPAAGMAEIRFHDPFLNRLRHWLSSGTGKLPPRPFFGAGSLAQQALVRLRAATGLRLTQAGGSV